MIEAYYSKKDGKSYQKGWRARPRVDGEVVDEKIFGLKERTKAQLWHDRIVSLSKKGYDFGFTLEDAFKLYLDDFSGTINGKRYANDSYRCLQKTAPHWLKKLVTEIRPSDISQMLREIHVAFEEQGRKRVHLKREVENLQAVFSHYRDEKNIDFVNPITRTHKKDWARAKGKLLVPKAYAHDPEEAMAFLRYLKQLPDPIYFHIAFWQLTSHRQRASEILGMEWSDVDWEKEVVWISGTMVHQDEFGKTMRNYKQYGTKEGRVSAPINFGGQNAHLKWSLSEMKSLCRSSRWVFADERGNVPALRQLVSVYKKSGFFQEKQLATHKCRKTAITLGTILCGADTAKTHAGHSSWSAHGRYVDREQRELSNPIPAAIAKSLGFGMESGDIINVKET